MAEAARRTGYGHGSDVVRRLIARPIRIHGGPTAVSAALVAQPEVSVEAIAPDDQTEAASPEIERLRGELLLLKAVLQAERSENVKLRACLEFETADETLGDEARALRDRWANLIDRLLHASV